MNKFNLGDISIVIPTYNRSDDLKLTLKSFSGSINELNEVLIIDQSTNDDIRKFVSGLKNKKIKYHHTDIASLTRARNFGIKKARGRIIGFLDDDVSLDKNYFDRIIDAFNDNSDAMGVSGWYLPKDAKFNKFDNFLKKIFFIEHYEQNNCRVLSAYGATYPYKLSKEIKSQWLSGFNMFFKKEVFKDLKFDENMKRYALSEDFDFSYRVYKRYPGSLIITPKAKIVHRVSMVERMPTERVSYMNQIHHFYLNYKNFDSEFIEKLKFYWVIFGISILRILLFLKTRRESDKLKLIYFFKSLVYTIWNLKRIKKGDLSFEAKN